MKRAIAYLLCFVCVSALFSCTNFKDESVDLGGVKIDTEKLSLSPESHVCNLTVRSGEKWTVSSTPDWLKVQSISDSRFKWDVSLSVSENNEYNRSGQLTLQSKSSTAVLTVEQQGRKGSYVPLTAVALSETSIEITEGETQQLKPVFTPENASNQNVTWKSSSTAVATVSSTGLVTAVQEGTATITVTTEEGGKTATCQVTVKKKVIPVTSVSLDKSTLTLTEEETYQLTATIDPADATNQNVSWTSDDTAVATVSSEGLVTAVQAGTATITVTTEDGGKTATCRVTVKMKEIPVTDVFLDYAEATLTEGDTLQLMATVSPSDATNQNVSWESSDTFVATVSDSGLITAVSEGTATITVTTEDGGLTASCLVTVIKEESGDDDGHEYVDLGLSVKWATCNVGASSPEEYGDYFAWGETVPKSDDSWATYKWCEGTDSTLTKYNINSDYGIVDDRTRLEMEDDAACANWGEKWRMPTDAEWSELMDNCISMWTIQNGVLGRKIVSKKNGNSIFLPTAGRWYEGSLVDARSHGYYWSSNLCTDAPDNAYCVDFSSRGIYLDPGSRSSLMPVRPVRGPAAE